ncbi:MAG TPA: STAS domain-containing protein [Solirubrobacteraceae bacterium]|jgi:ABC-type transporter Mla MlaB component|nr:STAS domain-containing protein [Solirubrobacteraceae bacterium]
MSSSPLVLKVHGPLCPADLPGLYEWACARLAEAGPRPVEMDVTGIEADAVALAAVARLALAARRHGCPVRLRGAGEEFRALLDLCGLWEAVGG